MPSSTFRTAACGYCTDDVARALIVACDAAAHAGEEATSARLVTTYLAFLHDAQLSDGAFHNFMGYDRRWQDDERDARRVRPRGWGLGYGDAMRRASPGVGRGRCAGRRSPRVTRLDTSARVPMPRSGWPKRSRRGPTTSWNSAPSSTRALDGSPSLRCARVPRLDVVRGRDDVRQRALPEALLRGGAALGNQRFVDIGLAMLSFYCRGDDRKRPSEPGRRSSSPSGTTAGTRAAGSSRAAGNSRSKPRRSSTRRWRRSTSPATSGGATSPRPRTPGTPGATRSAPSLATDGGCRDGVDDGLNANMGAESTICYLMSAIALANRSSASLHAVR